MSRSSLGWAPPVRTKLWYLKNIDFLQGMTEEQMAVVEKRTVMREVRRREVFYVPGEASDRIYLLKRGVVKISTFVEGREVILALLKRGEVFGEEEVLEGSRRDHMAEAYEDALVCVLPREVFLELMRANPEMAFKVTKRMGLRLRTFRSRVEGLLFKGASARLARVLLELAEEHGVEDARGTLLPLKLTQQDLASLIGMTRESVNMSLAEFREQGLVERQGRALRLLRTDALRAVR